MPAVAKPVIPSRAGKSVKVRVHIPGQPGASQTHQRTQDAVDALEQNAHSISTKTVASLPIGSTIVNHGLGRVPVGCSLTPTVASASFGWAMTAKTSTTATITTTGVAMTNVTMQFW